MRRICRVFFACLAICGAAAHAPHTAAQTPEAPSTTSPLAPPPSRPETPDRPLNPDTYFGINGAGFFHHPKDEAQNNRRWALIRELGVRWDRSDFWWNRMERRKGQWDFSLADRAMELYRSHGVQIFPILNYGAAWRDTRGPVDDEQRAEWAEYVSRVVSRYKGYSSHWEVWNEPNIIPFWRPQPDAAAYGRLLQVTAEKARAANPAARLAGFSLAGADHDYLENVLARAGADVFDIFSYHYYRTSQPEKTTPDEVAELRLILRHFGRECPIWVTEQGVTSNLREGVSEDLQAVYWMRDILLQIGAGVERVFPFTLVDNVSDPGGPWGSELGMVTLDWRPKPVFHAYRTMIAELGDYRLAGPVDLGLGDGVYAYLFERRAGAEGDGPRHKLAVWSVRDALDVRIPVDDIPTTLGADAKTRALAPLPEEVTSFTTLLGEHRRMEMDGATQRFMASSAPVYVPVVNRKLEENARTRFEPGEIMSSPGHTENALLSLALGEALSTAVRFHFPDGWQDYEALPASRIGGGDRETSRTATGRAVSLRFTVPSNARPGWYPVRATIPGASGAVEKTLRVWVRPELRGRMRPHVTSSTREIVTSFTVHNRNLAADTLWRFTAEPELPPHVKLAHGSLRAGTGDGQKPEFLAEAALRLPRRALEEIPTPTTFYLRTLAQTGDKPEEKRSPVFRIGVIPGPGTAPVPVLDGEWREYNPRATMILGQPDQVLRSDWRTDWGGENDSSAFVSAVWTKDGLYVGARIRDDHPAMNDRGVGGDVYKGDGLEIYLGTSGYSGEYYARKEGGYFHFALTPGRGGIGAAVSDFEKEVPGSRIAVRVADDSYVMEAFIPKEAFGGYEPRKGDIVPFDFQLNDRDDYSADARTSSLMWNGDEMNWLRAGKWGLVVVK